MVQKDLTEIFGGLFFFVALIYFAVMYFALRDVRATNSNNIYSTNQFGETQVVAKGDTVLDPLDV
jgi:hypothetical protein